MHIMLDLETWGKRPGCDLRSIGAVVFDPVAGIVCYDASPSPGGTFYVATDNPTEQAEPVQIGISRYELPAQRKYWWLTRDPETVKWWSEQSSEAQAAFANPVDLKDALELFDQWLSQFAKFDDFASKADLSHVRIWANGPQFDVSILEAAYHAVQLPTPWHYRAPRDFRTITEAAGMTPSDFCNYGEAHNALDDAIAQAMTVCEAYKRLGLAK